MVEVHSEYGPGLTAAQVEQLQGELQADLDAMAEPDNEADSEAEAEAGG